MSACCSPKLNERQNCACLLCSCHLQTKMTIDLCLLALPCHQKQLSFCKQMHKLSLVSLSRIIHIIQQPYHLHSMQLSSRTACSSAKLMTDTSPVETWRHARLHGVFICCLHLQVGSQSRQMRSLLLPSKKKCTTAAHLSWILLNGDAAVHAGALMGLAVVLVGAWLGELGGHLLPRCIQVVLMAERVHTDTLLHRQSLLSKAGVQACSHTNVGEMACFHSSATTQHRCICESRPSLRMIIYSQKRCGRIYTLRPCADKSGAHWHFVLVEDDVVWEANVVDPLNCLPSLNSQVCGVKHQAATVSSELDCCCVGRSSQGEASDGDASHLHSPVNKQRSGLDSRKHSTWEQRGKKDLLSKSDPNDLKSRHEDAHATVSDNACVSSFRLWLRTRLCSCLHTENTSAAASC